MSVNETEKDEFWDLDKIVPNKKPVMNGFATSIKTAEHEIPGEPDKNKAQRRINYKEMPLTSRNEEFSFVPDNMSLIKRITIKRTADKYDFYGNFRKAALIYYEYKMPKCDFTPFYSYMPQYTQLNSSQKNYYFYWRDEIRHGKFLKSDYAYLYLLVYEVLNLPDKIEPPDGIKLLCKLWREYRESLPRIDAYFSVWVQDYCFVHNLPCPISEVKDFIFDVIASSDFKEFYLSDTDEAGDFGTEAMIAYLSDYDWHKGKVTTEENAELYRTHINGAMRLVFKVLCVGAYSSEETKISVLTRNAFPNSLCTHAVKCKLDIEYVQLSADEELRKEVTAALRYTENKLRALFGVKSRLGVKDLPDNCRRTIDSYFDNVFEIVREKRDSVISAEYDKFYTAEKKELSFADADEIERASWTTTVRLVDTEGAEVDEGSDETAVTSNTSSDKDTVAVSETVNAENNDSECSTENKTDEIDLNLSYGLSADDIAALRAAMDGQGDTIDDMTFERINEAFSENFGDIVLEHDGEKYVVIEDYTEDVSEWLSKFE